MSGLLKNWWMTALRGFVALAFGFTLLAWPGADARVLSLAFGLFALVNGLALALVSLACRHTLEQWWVVLVEGIAGIAVAVVALTWPALSGLSLLALLAAWAVITGVFEIEAGVRLRRIMHRDVSLFAAGGLSVLVGVALVALPKDDPVEVVWAIGLFGVVYGALLVVAASRWRRVPREVKAGELPH